MLSRTVFIIPFVWLLCDFASAEEPKGTVIRPTRVDAKVKGCQVSKPGQYEAAVGDLIELEYVFPIHPDAMPKKMSRETDKGAIFVSDLGIRRLLLPNLIGTGTFVFYFEPRIAGKGTAFVVIDGKKYEYVFNVPNREDERSGARIKKVVVPSEGVTEFTVTGRSTQFRLTVSTIAGGIIGEPKIKGKVKHLGTAEIVRVGKSGKPMIGSLTREFLFRGTAAGKAVIEIKKTLPTQPMPVVERYTVTIR